ncbi:uncharacterized protein UTRI_01373 [Ustilago trichophora]|uniref:Uncharacterized protein n=1 Tax=Ustilago trichophora TaxID=86804 RepID=A0A5C3DWI5_9BASI|nr:uncharacterized protein UTRI_01373 [Ustilago trichophora]
MMSTDRPNAGMSALRVEVTPITSPVIPTQTHTVTISGHPTTVIAQSFADRIFITITQLNKFGVLYQAVTSSNPSSSAGDLAFEEPASTSSLPPPLPTTSVSKLVGTEPSPAHTALYQLYVTQIASIVKHSQGGQDARPLIVSLALKSSAQEGQKHTPAYGEDDDEDESLLMTSPEERERFIAIMEAVQRCRVW